MTSIQITAKIDIDFEQLIAGMVQLETSELETIIEKASLLLAQRREPHLSTVEGNLPKQINETLLHEIEERHNALQEKVREETITDSDSCLH